MERAESYRKPRLRRHTMTLTIDLPPDLQAQLRAEAARAGIAEKDYVLQALAQRLHTASASSKSGTTRLSPEETRLLSEINQGLPEETAQEYRDLLAKRRAETLTPEEQARLIEISDAR